MEVSNDKLTLRRDDRGSVFQYSDAVLHDLLLDSLSASASFDDRFHPVSEPQRLCSATDSPGVRPARKCSAFLLRVQS